MRTQGRKILPPTLFREENKRRGVDEPTGEAEPPNGPGSSKDAENAGTGPPCGLVASCHRGEEISFHCSVPGSPQVLTSSPSRIASCESALHVSPACLSLSLSLISHKERQYIPNARDLWGKATSPDQASLFTGTHMLGNIYPRNDPHSFSARSQWPGEFKKCP